MAISEIRRRIDKLERDTAADGTNLRILELIRAGAYYDELTDEEKELYAQHWNTDREALEEVNTLAVGSLHFQLTRLVQTRTIKRLNERIQEVGEIVNSLVDNQD